MPMSANNQLRLKYDSKVVLVMSLKPVGDRVHHKLIDTGERVLILDTARAKPQKGEVPQE